MAHKSPERQARSFRRYAAVIGGLVLAPVLAVSVASVVERANNGDPTAGWPAAGTTAAPNPQAPFLAPSETPKPGETHKGMEKSTDPGLKAIANVEKHTGYRFESNMLFTDGMPRNPEEARTQADAMAKRLKEYAKQGVKPLVVMEPTANKGKDFVDTTTLSDSAHVEGYRQTMDAYFGELNQAGVTTEQMGTWALLPQPNVPNPEWAKGKPNPEAFQRNWTIAAQNLKAHFRNAEPGDAQAAVMLDSATYPNNDWNNRSYDAEDLKKYTSGIPDGLVDVFVYQGMPYTPADDPEVFLNPAPAAEMANSLGIRKILLNTATAASFENVVTGTREQVTAEQREQTLHAEAQAAIALQTAGFDVSVNIHAEPAAPNSSEPDWAYHTPTEQQAVVDTIDYLSSATTPGVPVSLYLKG